MCQTVHEGKYTHLPDDQASQSIWTLQYCMKKVVVINSYFIFLQLMEVLVIGMNGLPVLRNAVEEIKQDQDDAITQLLNSED